MVSIERYTDSYAQEWNGLVAAAKNGTFLFDRRYMDYHADCFADHSLMFRNGKGKLIAVMPGHEKDGEYFSHRGLTYGGFVCTPKLHLAELGEIFHATMDYLRAQGFTKWYYKPVPTSFHRVPSEEDQYWLWRIGAEMTRCDMAQCVCLQSDAVGISSSKRLYHNKLVRQGYQVNRDVPIADFWPILEANLMERHNARPVHTLDEMLLLQGRFPKQIVCCTVTKPDGTVMGGTILYLTDTVVHTQYLSASSEGKSLHVLDLLLGHLINEARQSRRYRYFDFGTSMEANHTTFDEGLALQKEEFGARGIVYPEYTITL